LFTALNQQGKKPQIFFIKYFNQYIFVLMSKFLIIGLGNPGNEYVNTRHNIGFDVLNAFALKHNAFFQSSRLADLVEIKFKGKIFVCIKPNTFMNLSGRALKYWLDKEKIAAENSLTIVDDLALPLSKLRLRKRGSDAGHNGLRDIQNILGTDEFPKLRFGIGNQFPKGMQVEFVLSKWLKEEIPVVKTKIEKSTEIIEMFATIGIDRTMSDVNHLNF
jgi:PTH1 family peptidyl-tRNA hydrolase